MPKIFGFSRRRTKLGRLKVVDPSQGTLSPVCPTKSSSQINEDAVVGASASGRSEEHYCDCSMAGLGISKCGLECSENWTVLPTTGDKPAPRFQHAAAVVGSKMVVVGGDSGNGMLDDTMILSLDKLSWGSASKIYRSPNGSKIPACKDHCLVSWGKLVLLVGGKTDPKSDGIVVWSFDLDAECWSHVEVKGDVPAARSGHTVIRAGSILILFGGQDIKGRKLNDLHMFDLKSSTWLPLHYTGTRPSPRSNHVAALYDDRFLFVFGGQSKSRILNDLYSLDFETMVWSKIKIKGYHPSPRAGCGGILCGNRWYIVGGGSKKKRYAETLVFDVSKLEWSVSVTSSNDSIAISKGFSLVSVHYNDKLFLVAFGGNRKEPSNQAEVLVTVKNEHSMSWRSAPGLDVLPYEDSLGDPKDLAARVSYGRTSLVGRFGVASAVEHHASGRKSLSDSSIDPNASSGTISLRRQFHNEEEYNANHKVRKTTEEEKQKMGSSGSERYNLSTQVIDFAHKPQETTVKVDIAGILSSSEENAVTFNIDNSHSRHKPPDSFHSSSSDPIAPIEALSNSTNIYQPYETKIANLAKSNSLLKAQLSAALTNQDAIEKNLSSVTKSKQEMEKKLNDAMKEVEMLKEKLANLELVQEEANSVSNMVHSDNVRLEHDVAFLKAVLDDTQKELHSTRGVLAGERARAFQLQVEVFHLKQRLHSFENRAPTPRKPFHL
ncbi:acyl-CoA-binding domain-containing protein 5 [Phalaenopsis equestris]|uniref:acyl-CoA-binding domain-containing protein 5 n=1 Tax=Phalaenopsis equestris TaxID=78828 RepID=UPI0009E3F627|nr:acyl-CoA-binding domain-containing protein 5 [Phalaenopsis equestris]